LAAQVLIKSPKHTARDLARWAGYREQDEAISSLLSNKEQAAAHAIREFAQQPCYLGVSWGKDSVVVADLALRSGFSWPIVWVRVEPIKNPECFAVRDEFLAIYPDCDYCEIEVWCRKDSDGWHATGTLEQGFKQAVDICGLPRHVSGVRASESAMRKMRCDRWGVSSKNTCAPLARWSGSEVFAYLHKYDLPICSVYAMSFGGLLDREKLRVSSLGGERGSGFGRTEWERFYFGGVL
jgi:phosphoadenosine phosphosulfate reductase